MDFTEFNVRSSPANTFRDAIVAAAKKWSLPSCAIAAVIMRESNGEPKATEPVPPGSSHPPGIGLMQITWEGRDPSLYEPAKNIDRGCAILASSLKQVTAARDALGAQQRAALDAISPDILYFAFGGYNAGPSDVVKSIQVQHDPDRYTTDHYCRGTLAIYDDYTARSKAAG
jgi:soluble lytic murein transglycosylase-like protein